MLPWNDRAGNLTALKLIVFLGVLAPGAWIALQAATGTLGSKPITAAIHQSGDWAVRLLLLSLLVTPLRFIADWPKLILVRRMVGVAAAAYALAHLLFYVVEQAFDLQKVASEIILRFYLTIGFIGLVGLLVLSATSTDAMIRKLDRNDFAAVRRAYQEHFASLEAGATDFLLSPVDHVEFLAAVRQRLPRLRELHPRRMPPVREAHRRRGLHAPRHAACGQRSAWLAQVPRARPE